MTSHFIKNLYLGSDLSDEQLQNIPNARVELHIHALYKNLQVFLFIYFFFIFFQKFQCLALLSEIKIETLKLKA